MKNTWKRNVRKMQMILARPKDMDYLIHQDKRTAPKESANHFYNESLLLRQELSEYSISSCVTSIYVDKTLPGE